MDHLDKLESKSVYIIREAYRKFPNLAVLWSIGKDSTTMLHLVRKAFFGKIPFPVVNIDTTYQFDEMYEFRDMLSKKWDFDLIVSKNEEALADGIGYDTHDAVTCSNLLKTEALKKTIVKEKYRALLVGIRRDEHGIRAKERYFSPRTIDFEWDYKDQPVEMWDQFKGETKNSMEHMRVHPLLHWTELDIWKYIEREDLPTCELYFAKNGKRYRSLGSEPITNPVDSDADTIQKIIEELKTTDVSERGGRAQDKEEANAMQNLRALGYM